MSLGSVWLLPVVREISEDPASYVTLRKAATRQTAEGLAAVKPGAKRADLTIPPAWNDHHLATWSAVASGIRRDFGKEDTAKWDRAVFEGLAKNAGGPPAY